MWSSALELTARIAALGGGHILLTWQIGKDDAENVAKEIREFGGMWLNSLIRCDVFWRLSKAMRTRQPNLSLLPVFGFRYRTTPLV